MHYQCCVLMLCVEVMLCISCVMSASLKIGALVSFNSTINVFVQQAIQLAIDDVNNAEGDILHGSKLVLEMFDSGQDPVQAASCGNFFFPLNFILRYSYQAREEL